MRVPNGLLLITALACTGPGNGDGVTTAEAEQVRQEVEQTLRSAYDLSRPGAAERMLSLYPGSGRVLSTVGGRVTTSRDSLEAGIRYFWENVGVNMRDPRWLWDSIYVDVLSPAAAAVTASYHIPHLNPRGEPHVLGGAMTAVMVKRDGKWMVLQEHLSDLPQTSNQASNDSVSQ